MGGGSDGPIGRKKESVIRYRLNDNGHEVIWSYLVWRWKTE